jgi:hypothetical protein
MFIAQADMDCVNANSINFVDLFFSPNKSWYSRITCGTLQLLSEDRSTEYMHEKAVPTAGWNQNKGLHRLGTKMLFSARVCSNDWSLMSWYEYLGCAMNCSSLITRVRDTKREKQNRNDIQGGFLSEWPQGSLLLPSWQLSCFIDKRAQSAYFLP